jgi:hypothetical protein
MLTHSMELWRICATLARNYVSPRLVNVNFAPLRQHCAQRVNLADETLTI